MARSRSGGTTTVIFTDIEGHTPMMRRLGDARGRDVLRIHERITREALRRNGGSEVKTMGDGFLASFSSTERALRCAIDLQRAFSDHNDTAEEPIKIRIGVNAGEPIAERGDLFGESVISASRISAKAAGEEIFVSLVVRELVAGKGFLFSDRGLQELRGLDEPMRLYELSWRGEQTATAPSHAAGLMDRFQFAGRVSAAASALAVAVVLGGFGLLLYRALQDDGNAPPPRPAVDSTVAATPSAEPGSGGPTAVPGSGGPKATGFTGYACTNAEVQSSGIQAARRLCNPTSPRRT